MRELPKAYDHTSESDAYQQWESSGFFNPDNLPGERKEPFTISMPPPNVTGVLHLGHALENAIMDAMIRYQRMRGKRALLVAGTDHAAIATQARVEKNLIESGKYQHPREELGRENLLAIIRDYAEQSKTTILSQIRRMGTSCDWSRLAYTFDAQRSRAVNELFIRMYQDGLVYRGYRVINWSVKGQSTCSDDELVYKERSAKFYTFRYDAQFPIAISTTRPETKLGDTAVAVHPDDTRYRQYIGKTFTAEVGADKPLTLRIIADTHVDPSFGTGALGVTPAHSPTDYEMYERRKDTPDAIGLIPVIGADGRMTVRAGAAYQGLTVEETRKKFVEVLKTSGLIEKEEDITQNVGTSDRFGDIVEAIPMEQWFVAVNKEIPGKGKTLKDLMRDAVTIGHDGNHDRKIHITPDRYEKIYLNWIENLHDWCISRQIWWGHQIPAWHHKNSKLKIQNSKPCEEPIVSIEEIKTCPHCNGELEQDPDTLDTWFSSGAWTFSTLGWPDKTTDLTTFHPTTWIQMGHEILFFWMARMILMSTYALDEIPFKNVYIHGILRDENGKKFSKSLGNGIDPIDIIEKYGTDALRLAVLAGITPGNDARFYAGKVEHYGTFVNKLWNTARFILASTEALNIQEPRAHTLADTWILARLSDVIKKITDHMEQYRFSQAIETLYEFTWHEFADWYLEIAKFQRAQGLKETTDAILLYSLEQILKLWHPFTPFITEELWPHLNVIPAQAGIQKQEKNKGQHNLLLIQPWPQCHPEPVEGSLATTRFPKLQELVTSIRAFRAEQKINPKEVLPGTIAIAQEWRTIIQDHFPLIAHLTKVQFTLADSLVDPTLQLSGISIALNAPKKEETKEDLESLRTYIASLKTRLTDPSFLSKAPPHVVEKERQRLGEVEEKLQMSN